MPTLRHKVTSIDGGPEAAEPEMKNVRSTMKFIFACAYIAADIDFDRLCSRARRKTGKSKLLQLMTPQLTWTMVQTMTCNLITRLSDSSRTLDSIAEGFHKVVVGCVLGPLALAREKHTILM